MNEGLSLKIKVDSAGVQESLRGIRDVAKETAGSLSGLKSVFSSIGPVGAAIGIAVAAAAAAVASVTQNVGDAIAGMDKLGKSAQEAGASVEKFSELSFGALFSDVSPDDLSVSFKTLSQKMQEALAGGKEATAVFQKLGVAFQNVDGSLRGPDAVFRDVVASMSKMQDGAQKTALAVDLFGRSGQKLIPIINEGTDGLDEWAQKAREAGAVISGDLAKQADDFGDSMQLLKQQFKGIFLTIASELLPALNQISRSIQQLIQDTGALRIAMDAAKEITDVIIYVGHVLTGTFQTIAIGVSAMVKNIVSEFRFLGSALESTFGAIVQSAQAYGKFLGDAVTAGPVAALKELRSNLSTVFTDAFDGMGAAMAKRSSGFVSIWRDAANEIGSIWKKRFTDLVTPFSGAAAIKTPFSQDNPVLNTPGKVDKDTTELLRRVNDEYAKATMGRLELLEYERDQQIQKLREQLKDEEEFQGAKLGIEIAYARKRRDVIEDQRRAQADVELAAIRGREGDISGDKDITQAQRKAQLVPLLQQENELVAQQLAIYRSRSLDGTLSDEQRIEASRKINELERERVRILQQVRDLQSDTFGGTFRRGMIEMFDEFGNVSRNLANGALKTIRNSIDGITDGIMGALDGTLTFGQVASRVFRQMVTDLIRVAVQALVVKSITSFIPGFGGFLGIGSRATGGPVMNRGLYQLAENGPEFVLNAQATRKLTLPVLNDLNAGRMPAMPVQSAPRSGGVSGIGNMRIGVAVVDKRSDYESWVESNHFEKSVMTVVRRNRV